MDIESNSIEVEPTRTWLEIDYLGEVLIVDVTIKDNKVSNWDLDKDVHPLLNFLLDNVPVDVKMQVDKKLLSSIEDKLKQLELIQ